jgi:hypothetical protein
LALGEKKVAAPHGFHESWRFFNDEYRTAIHDAVSLAIQRVLDNQKIIEAPSIAWLNSFLNDEPTAVTETPEGKVTEYSDWLARATKAGQPPFFNTDREFTPGLDNPIRLVEMAIDYFDAQQDKADDTPYFDDAHKVADAWDYLKDALGLDTGGLWARWSDVQQVLSPHVGHPAIAELYDEAVRCFAFGQFAAAMAMCRALLEQVLDRLYGALGDGLEAKIREAEDHFDDLRSFKLIKLKNLADDALHNYNNSMARGTDAERVVSEFLRVLKDMIERAKPRK